MRKLYVLIQFGIFEATGKPARRASPGATMGATFSTTSRNFAVIPDSQLSTVRNGCRRRHVTECFLGVRFAGIERASDGFRPSGFGLDGVASRCNCERWLV